ncbi:MAG: enoyl-CoA hydratase-related protein [Bacteroidales bacterium]|jgi:enoyl-CoA hydratase|nr:enoyl-CoA hydratase-related protein [Bacteroidales bacterium]
MEYQILNIQIMDRIAVVVISRPAAMNALNSDFFSEFNHFLDDLEPRDDVKVLVITGAGKSFVAGADIAEMVNFGKEQGLAFSIKGQRTFDRLEQLNIPVIAAINGYALGGGCELAMACDFRIASNLARFGQPEMNLGLMPGYAGTQRLSRLTGLGNALYMILTAATISADDALRIGLVQKVTEPGSLMEEVMKLASKIADNGSQAVAVAKKIIRQGLEKEFSKASQMESEAFAKLFDQAATKEGLKAFLEKRKPDW